MFSLWPSPVYAALLRMVLQVLSANAESSLNIECLMDDVDVKSELNREQLEEMIAPFLGRLQAVLRSALESSGAACRAARAAGAPSSLLLFKLVGEAAVAAAAGYLSLSCVCDKRGPPLAPIPADRCWRPTRQRHLHLAACPNAFCVRACCCFLSCAVRAGRHRHQQRGGAGRQHARARGVQSGTGGVRADPQPHTQCQGGGVTRRCAAVRHDQPTHQGEGRGWCGGRGAAGRPACSIDRSHAVAGERPPKRASAAAHYWQRLHRGVSGTHMPLRMLQR